MAENQAADTAVETEEKPYEYPIKIEEAGPGTKKVSIEIPQEKITERLSEQFKELRQQAAIPGFRPGHAPQKLIEKRFASDVREQVRRSLISESYEQAIEKNSLQVIGEPQFDNPDAIKLPDSGPMTYSFEVEVQPEFTVPSVEGVKIKKPKIEVTEENINQALQNLREQQGALVPAPEGAGVQEKDYLTVDATIKSEGAVAVTQEATQLVSRPGRVAGINIADLDKQLAGLKIGETRTINAKAPETHPNEALRNKDVAIEIVLKDLKRLELAELDQEFLDSLGFKDEAELREALKEQMIERIEFDVQQAMRDQVNKHLVDNTQIELPAKLSIRQTDRVVNRRAVDLMMKGIPREQIEANIEALKAGAVAEAVRELKLFFILQKIANEKNIEVDEAELNGRIAMIAAQRGKRPEKLKQEMAKDGTLANLYLTMREQKAVNTILEKAQIEEVAVEELSKP